MNGVQIELDGGFLDLEGAKVRIKLNSPVFYPDFIKHSYSYPISAPWTPQNARLLKHAERIANIAAIPDETCNLYIDGLFWKKGRLRFRGFKNGRYDLDIDIPPQDIVLQLREKRMQDLTLGGTIDLDPGFAPSLADVSQVFEDHLGTIDDTPYVFPSIRNDAPLGDGDFFGGPDPTVAPVLAYVNYYNDARSEPMLYYNDSLSYDYWVNLYSPCFYLVYVLQQLFGEHGFTLGGDIPAEDEVRRQIILSNYLHSVIIEVFSPGVVAYNNAQTEVDPTMLVPYMSVIEFMVACQQRFGGVFIFEKNQQAEFKSYNSILNSADALDITEYIVPDPEMDTTQGDGYTLTFSAEPLDTLGDTEEEVDLDRLIATVDAYSDLASLSPVRGDMARVLTTNTLWKFADTGISLTDWVEVGPYMYSEVVGDGETQQDVGVGLTRMTSETDAVAGSRLWLLPHVSMPGQNIDDSWHNMGINQLTKLRLLYYRGLQDDSVGNDYPLATVGVNGYGGSTISGAEHHEAIGGEGGIYEVRWRKWMDWLENQREHTYYARLPIHMLTKFQFSRKVRVNSVNYLVRSIDFEAGDNGLALAKLEMLKTP